MNSTRCILRQALLSRHYPKRPPAPTAELLQRADELLCERPTTTSACHTHLNSVYNLIKDLQPREADQESWKAWNAKIKLWTHWLDGVTQLHSLGAFSARRTKRSRLKADDLTPLLLSIQSSSWFGRRAKKDGTAIPDMERVFRTMYELGLRPTPFQLALALQHVPIGEMLDRAERVQNSTSELGGLDRVALQLHPMLRPTNLDQVGLRRRAGVRHHEIELEKLQHFVDRQVIEAVGRGDTRFEPMLQASRKHRAERLTTLLDKVISAGLGVYRRVVMMEVQAAFDHIVDVLRLGNSLAFVDLEAKNVELTNPVEVYKLLVAGMDILRQRPASSRSALSAPSKPSPSPSASSVLSSGSTQSFRKSTTLKHYSVETSPNSPFKVSPVTSPASVEWKRSHRYPARQALKFLALHCARTRDLKGTLALCTASTFPIAGWRDAPFLAGAAQTPDDLRLLLPHLERLNVTPSPQPVRAPELIPPVVWRLRRLAIMLDAELDRAEKGAAGYTKRVDALFRSWGLLPSQNGEAAGAAVKDTAAICADLGTPPMVPSNHAPVPNAPKPMKKRLDRQRVVTGQPKLNSSTQPAVPSSHAQEPRAPKPRKKVRARKRFVRGLYTATVPSRPRFTPAPTNSLDRILVRARSP